VIRSFPIEDLERDAGIPFGFRAQDCVIQENFCRGTIDQDGHRISWDLQYLSHFSATLSNKGWIGFSRTPHSDAVFSGEIRIDGRQFVANPLGFGLQGHNCGYRHRGFWRWAHGYFRQGDNASTLEALAYDMPLGLVFRKAVLWHEGQAYVFRNFAEQVNPEFRWNICATTKKLRLNARFDGTGTSLHKLPYLKTDCTGTFNVRNNSLANAIAHIEGTNGADDRLKTIGGAVLEMTGG
jgi:hypothetical protein